MTARAPLLRHATAPSHAPRAVTRRVAVTQAGLRSPKPGRWHSDRDSAQRRAAVLPAPGRRLPQLFPGDEDLGRTLQLPLPRAPAGVAVAAAAALLHGRRACVPAPEPGAAIRLPALRPRLPSLFRAILELACHWLEREFLS